MPQTSFSKHEKHNDKPRALLRAICNAIIRHQITQKPLNGTTYVILSQFPLLTAYKELKSDHKVRVQTEEKSHYCTVT